MPLALRPCQALPGACMESAEPYSWWSRSREARVASASHAARRPSPCPPHRPSSHRMLGEGNAARQRSTSTCLRVAIARGEHVACSSRSTLALRSTCWIRAAPCGSSICRRRHVAIARREARRTAFAPLARRSRPYSSLPPDGIVSPAWSATLRPPRPGPEPTPSLPYLPVFLMTPCRLMIPCRSRRPPVTHSRCPKSHEPAFTLLQACHASTCSSSSWWSFGPALEARDGY